MSGPDLIQRFIDDDLDAESERALVRWLEAEPTNRVAFVRATSLDRALRECLVGGAQVSPLLKAERPAVVAGPTRRSGRRPLRLHRRRTGTNPTKWVALIAAGLLLAAGAVALSRQGAGPVADDGALAVVVSSDDPSLRPGQRLKAGAVITAVDGPVTLAVPGESTRLVLDRASELALAPSAPGRRFALRQGRIAAEVAPQPVGQPLVIATAEADLTVIGTRFAIASRERRTQVEVEHGRVRLGNTSGAVEIGAGATATAIAAAAPRLRPVRAPAPARVTAGLHAGWWLTAPSERLPDMAWGRSMLDLGAGGTRWTADGAVLAAGAMVTTPVPGLLADAGGGRWLALEAWAAIGATGEGAWDLAALDVGTDRLLALRVERTAGAARLQLGALSAGLPADGALHHLVVRRIDDRVALFIDGVEAASGTVPRPVSSGAASLRLAGPTGGLDTRLAFVAVHHVALGDAEISANHASALSQAP